MTVRSFVDSNILIYAHDGDAGFRHRRASEVLVELWASGGGLLSTQVLQEFYVNVTRKIKSPLTPSAAREVVRDYAAWVESPITPATVARASEIAEIWNVSFWDGMILAAAEQNRADMLFYRGSEPWTANRWNRDRQSVPLSSSTSITPTQNFANPNKSNHLTPHSPSLFLRICSSPEGQYRYGSPPRSPTRPLCSHSRQLPLKSPPTPARKLA